MNNIIVKLKICKKSNAKNIRIAIVKIKGGVEYITLGKDMSRDKKNMRVDALRFLIEDIIFNFVSNNKPACPYTLATNIIPLMYKGLLGESQRCDFMTVKSKVIVTPQIEIYEKPRH